MTGADRLADLRGGVAARGKSSLRELLDVSRPLREGMAVWPGDTPFRRVVAASPGAQPSVTVSALTLSSHAGTHVDAPVHVDPGGGGVETLDLRRFVGPALVLDARGRQALGEELVTPDALRSGRRLLFRTDYAAQQGGKRDEYGAHIPYLTTGLAHRLVEASVPLVGLDGPSVDPFDSDSLEAHRILAAGGVVILEHLDLAGVEAGEWSLVALPLRIAGGDASPVRAVLFRDGP